MLKTIRSWLGGKPPVVPQPDDIIKRIEHNLGVLNHDVINRYSVRKAMKLTLRLSSSSPKEFSEWLSNAARVVDNQEYAPESWKQAIRVEGSYDLDNFMTHAGFIIDPKVWFAENKPRITRLIKAFNKLEIDDREYYQRMYNSVLRDCDAILQGYRTVCL